MDRISSLVYLPLVDRFCPTFGLIGLNIPSPPSDLVNYAHCMGAWRWQPFLHAVCRCLMYPINPLSSSLSLSCSGLPLGVLVCCVHVHLFVFLCLSLSSPVSLPSVTSVSWCSVFFFVCVVWSFSSVFPFPVVKTTHFSYPLPFHHIPSSSLLSNYFCLS